MSVQDRVDGALGAVDHEWEERGDGTPCVRVKKDGVRPLMEALKNACGFETCTFVTAVDRDEHTPRFELVWEFLSIQHNDRLRVRCLSNEEFPTVPTIVDLWPGAAFFERECYDMFGVVYEGNPDLRRLLMPQAYEHHPLRKEFPHQGIEPDKLYRAWDKQRRQEGTVS